MCTKYSMTFVCSFRSRADKSTATVVPVARYLYTSYVFDAKNLRSDAAVATMIRTLALFHSLFVQQYSWRD